MSEELGETIRPAGETQARVEALNRAFGSKTGDRPSFRFEAEGADYLFGRRPRPRATEVVKALAALDEVGGDLEKLGFEHLEVLRIAAEEIRLRGLQVQHDEGPR